MPNALLIANPASSGFSRHVHRRVSALLARKHELIDAWPSSAEHARELTAKAVADGVDLVVAMGGDGIVHHVAQSLVGSDAVLGVVPCGTANVVARQLDIPTRALSAAKLLVGQYSVIDAPVLEVTGSATTGPLHRYAVFSFGAGADADIVAAAESEPHRKRDLGPLHYAATATRLVRRDLRRRVPELRIDAGDRSTLGIGAMAQFRPSYTYFGRAPMRLSPVSPNPITLLIVEQLRLRRLISTIWATVGRSGLEGLKGFDIWSDIDEFSVAAAGRTAMQLDGEILSDVNSISARILPGSLRIAVPHHDPSP